MEVAITLAGVGAVLVAGFGVACFECGCWKTRTAVLKIAEERSRKAMEAASRPVPDSGAGVLDELSDA